MRLIVFLLFIATGHLFSQSIAECKERFDKYLNLKNSLNSSVLFEKNVIYIVNSNGKKEFSVYENEIPVVSAYLENFSVKDQINLYNLKGTKKFSRQQLDSLKYQLDTLTKRKDEITKQRLAKSNKPLTGYRIALDPGHFSSNIIDSKVEGKFINFVSYGNEKDTIKLVEGQLTFLTAQILKAMLEEQGAKVFLSRNAQNTTAFNVPYYYWYNKRRKPTLDSLKQINEITNEQYNNYMSLNKEMFFWRFFRDYELVARATKINTLDPDLTIILHFNVDEKNAPWAKASTKNFTMCFIGGAFVRSDLKKTNNKLHFLRLLLTKQINKSENLSQHTVRSLSKNLNITIAKPNDADYLCEKGIKCSQDGVFCRNLILTRYINSPLVYGESLYQDNIYESAWLNSCNYVTYGYKVPERIHYVAKSYLEATLKYFNK